MKANQWTLKSAKVYEVLLSQKSRGQWQSAGCPYPQQLLRRSGELSLPGETIGNHACAKAQERQRKGHIKEAARDPEDKFYRFIWGPPSSHLLGVSILKPGKEFGWGRVEPFSVCQGILHMLSHFILPEAL